MDDEFVFAELVEKTIRKVGNEYCVFSKKSGKNLGCSPSRKGAIKRLGQIEFFKHQKSLAEDEIVAALESGSLSATDEELKSFLGDISKSIVAENSEDDTQNCSLVEDAKRNYLHHKSLFEEVKHLPGEHDQGTHGRKKLSRPDAFKSKDGAVRRAAKSLIHIVKIDISRSIRELGKKNVVDEWQSLAPTERLDYVSNAMDTVVYYTDKNVSYRPYSDAREVLAEFFKSNGNRDSVDWDKIDVDSGDMDSAYQQVDEFISDNVFAAQVYGKSEVVEKHLPGEHDQQSHAGGAARLSAISSIGQLLDDATSEFAKVKVDENWLDMQRSSDVLTRSALVDIVEYVAKQSDVKISNKDAQNIVDYNLKGIDKWTTRMKDFMGRGASDYPEPWTWRGDVNDDALKNSLAEQLQDYSEEKSTALHADTGIKTELELAKRDRDIRGRHNAWSPEADKNVSPEDVVGKEKKVLPSEKINEEDTKKENRYRTKSLIEKRVVEVTSMWKDEGRALRDLDKAERDYLNSDDDTKTLFLKSFYDKLATVFDRRFTKEDKQKPIVKHARNESLYEFESSIRKHLAGRHDQATHAGGIRAHAAINTLDDDIGNVIGNPKRTTLGQKAREHLNITLSALADNDLDTAMDSLETSIRYAEQGGFDRAGYRMRSFLKELEGGKTGELSGDMMEGAAVKHLPNQHDQKTHAGMKGAAGKVSHTPAQLREAAARQHAKDTGMSLTEARKKVGSGIKVPTARVINQFDATRLDAKKYVNSLTNPEIIDLARSLGMPGPRNLNDEFDHAMKFVNRQIERYDDIADDLSTGLEKSDVVTIVSEVIKSIKK